MTIKKLDIVFPIY